MDVISRIVFDHELESGSADRFFLVGLRTSIAGAIHLIGGHEYITDICSWKIKSHSTREEGSQQQHRLLKKEDSS